MEKIIAKDCVTPRQYGRRVTNFFTGQDAIARVIDNWERALDNKETIHAVYFDFSKAFDLVHHKRLMQKLKKLLPPYLTSWIAERLRDRKQRVKSIIILSGNS
jgi:hypothetical protein